MIINLNLTTTASRENTKIIRDLCKEICDYYYIEYNGEAVFELTTDSSSVLVDWAKDRYKLTLIPFSIGKLAHGFEIVEDEYFTMYMLKISK